jgi:hypothetical protein
VGVSSKHIRLALTLVNGALLVALGVGGVQAFTPSALVGGLPEAFDPTALAIGDTRPGLELEHLAVVWQQLDRPKAVAPPPPPQLAEAVVVGPTWRLLMANVDPSDPSLGSGIVIDDTGQQMVLRPGERVAERPTYLVLGIAIQGDGADREAVATLEGPGGHQLRLSLRREPTPTAN